MRTISTEGFTGTGASFSFTVGVGGSVSRVYGVLPVYGAGAPGTTVFALSNLGRTFFTSPATATAQYYAVLETAFGANGVVLSTGNPYVEAVVSGTITVNWTTAAAGAGYGMLLFLYDD